MEKFKKAMVSFIGGLPNSSIYYKVLEVLEKEEFIDSDVKFKKGDILLEEMNPLQKATYTLLQIKEIELLVLLENRDSIRKEVNKKEEDLAKQLSNQMKTSDPEKFSTLSFDCFQGRAAFLIKDKEVFKKFLASKALVSSIVKDIDSIKDFFLRIGPEKSMMSANTNFEKIRFRKGYLIITNEKLLKN